MTSFKIYFYQVKSLMKYETSNCITICFMYFHSVRIWRNCDLNPDCVNVCDRCCLFDSYHLI